MDCNILRIDGIIKELVGKIILDITSNRRIVSRPTLVDPAY